MQTPDLLSKDGSIHVTNEQINTISHLVGICLTILGAALLIVQSGAQGDVWKIVGLSIYSLALLNLFVFSTLHHGINGSPRLNEVLRTFDYVSVFGLIAGTVTPLVLVHFRDPYGWAVLSAVWTIAIGGIVLRSVHRSLPKYITNTLYIVLGWLPVALIVDSPQLPFSALVLLAMGGVIYSVGFLIFVIEKPNIKPGIFGFHELWHLLVVLAAAIHYFLMYCYVLN
ncbi:hemolysin III family protein [soil metagenome]